MKANSIKHTQFTLLSVLLLLTLPCQANENVPSEDLYFQEMPVVLTASRLSQPLSEAPSAMTVIGRKMIKASGFRTVPELMRLVPGMYVGFADANRPVVSLHNSTDEFAHRMQILIDGRSIYLPPFGGVSWADLPLLIEDIERIEVVRGPSSASHGTNSFYGVINIITRDALTQGASVSVTSGNYWVSDASARFGKSLDDFDYRISAGYRSDQGLDNSVLNDHNNTRVFNFRGNYQPNVSDSLDVQLGSSNGVYGMGIAGRPEDAFRNKTAQSNFQQVSWLHVWPTNDETKLTLSHTSRDSLDPYLCINSDGCQGNMGGRGNPLNLTVAQSFTQQKVYSQRNELELQNTQQLGASNRLVWGGGLRRDHANYPLLFDRSYTLRPWQVFAHDEWRVTEAAVLNLGTMFESNGMGHKNNSPRASFNYHFTQQHTVRMGMSTATRSPVMAEAYLDANNTIFGGAYVPPTTPLTPEKILSREIGYLGEFPSLNFSLDARAYVNTVSDLILVDKYVALTAAFPDSYKNVGSAEFKGVEATAKYRWNEGHSFLVASYAYQEGSAGLSSLPTQYYNTAADPLEPLRYTSIGDRVRQFYQTEYFDQFSQTVVSNSASLLLSQSMGDSWQFSAGYYFRGKVRVIDVSPDVTPEYTMRRLDLRVAKTFKFDKERKAEVALVVQNATQDDYTKYGTVNAVAEVLFTRRGWLTATLNF